MIAYEYKGELVAIGSIQESGKWLRVAFMVDGYERENEPPALFNIVRPSNNSGDITLFIDNHSVGDHVCVSFTITHYKNKQDDPYPAIKCLSVLKKPPQQKPKNKYTLE